MTNNPNDTAPVTTLDFTLLFDALAESDATAEILLELENQNDALRETETVIETSSQAPVVTTFLSD